MIRFFVNKEIIVGQRIKNNGIDKNKVFSAFRCVGSE
jgi:hypothetical protein